MSTLISQFSGACGLRFRNKETGAMRGVRVNNDLFLPPNGAMGWPTDVTFNVVYRFVYKLPCYGIKPYQSNPIGSGGGEKISTWIRSSIRKK